MEGGVKIVGDICQQDHENTEKNMYSPRNAITSGWTSGLDHKKGGGVGGSRGVMPGKHTWAECKSVLHDGTR